MSCTTGTTTSWRWVRRVESPGPSWAPPGPKKVAPSVFFFLLGFNLSADGKKNKNRGGGGGGGGATCGLPSQKNEPAILKPRAPGFRSAKKKDRSAGLLKRNPFCDQFETWLFQHQNKVGHHHVQGKFFDASGSLPSISVSLAR